MNKTGDIIFKKKCQETNGTNRKNKVLTDGVIVFQKPVTLDIIFSHIPLLEWDDFGIFGKLTSSHLLSDLPQCLPSLFLSMNTPRCCKNHT